MKQLSIFLSILIWSCSASKQASTGCPPPAKADTVTETVTITIPVTVPVHDTTVIRDTTVNTVFQQILVGFPLDTVHHIVKLAAGSDWQTVQAAVNYQQTHNGIKIMPAAGTYSMIFPVMATNIQGSDYGQAFLDIEGPVNAQNTPGNQCARFVSTFSDAPALLVQQCKGCTISNIIFEGNYLKSAHMGWMQIDTTHFADWADGTSRVNRTSPYCAICIDPFSQPRWYDSTKGYEMYPRLKPFYLPGMGQEGSTDVRITNCLITQFPVGVIVTPSMQANGEMVHLEKCSISSCMSAYAQTQAQSKANTVKDCMFWGNIHTIIDCAHWGFPRTDAVNFPWVDGVNVAGYNFQFCAGTPINFPTVFQRVYAEGLFRLCDFGGFPKGYPHNGQTLTRSGVMWRDCSIDFQTQQPGIPSPDFYVNCPGCVFDGCMLRIYNNESQTQRIVFADESAVFRDGVMGWPPVGARTDSTYNYPTIFDNLRLTGRTRYPALNSTAAVPAWETMIAVGQRTLVVDRGAAAGYFLDSASSRYFLYDQILANAPVSETISPGAWNPDEIVGQVIGVRGDTVYLGNVGPFHTGDVYPMFIDRIVQY